MQCKSLWIKASAKCINVNVYETQVLLQCRVCSVSDSCRIGMFDGFDTCRKRRWLCKLTYSGCGGEVFLHVIMFGISKERTRQLER